MTDTRSLLTTSFESSSSANGRSGNSYVFPGLTAADLHRLASIAGAEFKPASAVRLTVRPDLTPAQRIAAWQRGNALARALREQERLTNAPVADKILCAMAGVSETVLGNETGNVPLSFALRDAEEVGRIALRSEFRAGRRFGLARLLGDGLAGEADDRLYPATAAETYRQNVQWAFAAELLCPYDALVDRLGGDVSSEATEEAANYFQVPERTILMHLANRRLVGCEELQADRECSAV